MTSTRRDGGEPPRSDGPGTLSVVTTPIGNLEDITLRALRVLREADGILAEDTRRTRALCHHYAIPTRLRSFHAHSPNTRLSSVVEELGGGAHLALVTDAGTPLVSDPGARLVRAAADAGVHVEVVPGPSAVTASLAVAGLRCDRFRFVGFLPRGGKRRRQALEGIHAEPGATILFEAPGRVGKTLTELDRYLGSARTVAVCRELTKAHEEVIRGTPAELAARFAGGARGEVTIVVGGLELSTQDTPDTSPAHEEVPDSAIRGWLADGTSPRDAARHVAERSGSSRRAAYQRVLRLAEERETDDER